MNPGNMDECLGISRDATTYCFPRMISSSNEMGSITKLAKNPILPMNLPNISKIMKRIIKTKHLKEKLANQSEVAVLADPDMIKNHIRDIGKHIVRVIRNYILLA